MMYYFIFLSLEGETYERARRLQDKMKTNLEMVKDRLEILGMFIKGVYFKMIHYS